MKKQEREKITPYMDNKVLGKTVFKNYKTKSLKELAELHKAWAELTLEEAERFAKSRNRKKAALQDLKDRAEFDTAIRRRKLT